MLLDAVLYFLIMFSLHLQRIKKVIIFFMNWSIRLEFVAAFSLHQLVRDEDFDLIEDELKELWNVSRIWLPLWLVLITNKVSKPKTLKTTWMGGKVPVYDIKMDLKITLRMLSVSWLRLKSFSNVISNDL